MTTEALTTQPEYLPVQPGSPEALIALAVDKNLDLDKLERLLAMKERQDKEAARTAFFEALTAFQEECPDIRKTKGVKYSDNEAPKYFYAPLSDIDRQIKPLLKIHGFTKRWEMVQADGKITGVTCILTHKQGHTEKTTVPTLIDNSGGKNAIQAIGSGMQYGQRYSLIAALGITTADQDIDGRLPELDIDKLHKQYIEIYDQICQKDHSFISPGNPDNWAAERTPHLYVKAIGKARQHLTNLMK